MNTLIFIAGMGLGALLATIILLGAIRLMMAGSKKAQRDTFNLNQQNNMLLQERNDIGKRQADALQKIAWQLTGDSQ